MISNGKIFISKKITIVFIFRVFLWQYFFFFCIMLIYSLRCSSSVLASVHWPLVELRIDFNVLLTFKALNGFSSNYTAKLLIPYKPGGDLRSSKRTLKVVPKSMMVTKDDRAFAIGIFTVVFKTYQILRNIYDAVFLLCCIITKQCYNSLLLNSKDGLLRDSYMKAFKP